MASLPRRAYLGAELADDAFGEGGVRIAGVSPGGMAESAGLRAGDVMIELAGLPVRDPSELSAALRGARTTATTELVWLRGGGRLSKRVAGRRLSKEVDMIAQPLEDLEGIEYGEIAVEGARLRTITTRVQSPRAIVVVIQGIACESIDCGATPEAPLAGLVAGWARAGYDTLRFDKRGVGDSEGGPCQAVDFETELADVRAVVAHGRLLAGERGLPVVLFGHGVGGMIAASLATEPNVSGLMTYGTPKMGWVECLRHSLRRQAELQGESEKHIGARLAQLDELLSSDQLDGRTAAYHAGLEALDLEAAWRGVSDLPVLVVHGEYDWVDDQVDIAALLNEVQVIEVRGLDHLLGHHANREASVTDYGNGVFDQALVDVTVAWLRRMIHPA